MGAPTISIELSSLKKPKLRQTWQKVFGSAAPNHLRSDLMRRFIIYRVQEQSQFALSPSTARKLLLLARATEAELLAALQPRSPIKPGTRIVRKWRGRVHVVEAEPNCFTYQGNQYQNLSQIARLITGTRWSGPLFFGLKPAANKKAKEIQ